MKRLLVVLVLLMPMMALAQSPIDKLFDKYANKDGFTTVRISGALLGFASKMDSSNSPESKMLSDLKGIRILTVEDEELNQKLDFFTELGKDDFFKKNGYEVLMEVTEKDEVVRFFGKMTSGGKLSEMVLVVGGDDNALICIEGLIDPDNIGKITGALNIDGIPSVDKK